MRANLVRTFKLGFLVIIMFCHSNSFALDLKGIETHSTDRFCDDLEQMLPKMVKWRYEELKELRKSIGPVEYAYACVLYARDYYDSFHSDNLKGYSNIELRMDSILTAGMLYTLGNNLLGDHGSPYLIFEYASMLENRGQYELSALFADVGVLSALNSNNGGFIYGELRSLEAMLTLPDDPDSAIRTQLAMLSGFEQDYVREQNEYTHSRLTKHYLRTCEMLLNAGKMEMADSLLQVALDFIYDRRNPDVIEGKVSIILPTSNHMIHTNAIQAEINFRKGNTSKMNDNLEALLWRFHENEILKQLPSYDYRDYFRALQYLCQHNAINENNTEHLDYATRYVQEYIRQLSPKLYPKLRDRYYADSRKVIFDINSQLVKNINDETSQEIYNNVVLFKGLLLQVSKSLNLNAVGINISKIKGTSKLSVLLRLLYMIVDMDYKSWSLQQQALGNNDFALWLGCDWKMVKNALGDNDVAIEFFTAGQTSPDYYAAVINKASSKPQIIKLFNECQLKTLNPSNFYKRTNLSALIWKPLKTFLHRNGRVYISSDAELHNIAVENLPCYFTNGYMSDIYDIRRVSSTKEIITSHARTTPDTKNMLVFGAMNYDFKVTEEIAKDNLNGDELLRSAIEAFVQAKGFAPLNNDNHECEKISSIMSNAGWNVNLFVNNSAVEQNFYNAINIHPDVIHISTHGFYIDDIDSISAERFTFLDDFNPSRNEDALKCSGLVFSGANQIFEDSPKSSNTDGILSALEVSQCDLSGTELVTLSACQTGLGKVSGDGVYGMQRGFKQAGVKTLLVTLWDVSDEMSNLLL